MVEKVLKNKPTYFDMEDFVADKAYTGRKVYDFVNKLGLNPIIPFKKNHKGNPKGVWIWREIFDYFQENREEFDKRYHKRSNVETTFHMVKKRFGNNVLTKSLQGNVNEIKIKFLCHNICVLIQEIYESDINIDFTSCVKNNRSV